MLKFGYHGGNMFLHSVHSSPWLKFFFACFTAIALGAIFVSVQSEPEQEQITTEEHKASNEWLKPIDTQLRALRDSDYVTAYETTSKDFKSATTLEKFIEFVKKYPILASHTNILVHTQAIKDNNGEATVILDPDTDAIPIKYMVVIEDGKWKIWNMSIVPPFSPKVASLLKDLTTLKPVVDNFLQALREKKPEQAYQEFTSKKFQESTSLEEFKHFLAEFSILNNYVSTNFKDPKINKGTGTIVGELYSQNEVATLLFTLGIDKEQWKIWGISVVKVSPNISEETYELIPHEKSTPSTQGALEFTKIEVGDKINKEGDIIEPQTKFQSAHQVIYVNVFVNNGFKEKVVVNLKNLETKAILPEVSTTIQKEGQTIISLSFSPPLKGWPKGHYQLDAVSSSGAQRQLLFTIE